MVAHICFIVNLWSYRFLPIAEIFIWDKGLQDQRTRRVFYWGFRILILDIHEQQVTVDGGAFPKEDMHIF